MDMVFFGMLRMGGQMREGTFDAMCLDFMPDGVKRCGVPEELEKFLAVAFAAPSGDPFDDNECPGYDGHADQYDKNRFSEKIALGDEMTESDVAGGRFHFLAAFCWWNRGVISRSG